MAGREDLEFTYSSIDRIFRLSLGELADFSGAKYDGDFSQPRRGYRGLFARIGTVLPDKGRFFLQTMVFGRNMIPADRIGINAPRESDAWYLALIGRQFPGSFLPFGQEQIVRSAEPHFRLVSSTSGRLDYIETIREWRKWFAGPSVGKMLLSESVEAAAGPAASSSRSREIPVGRYCFAPKGAAA